MTNNHKKPPWLTQDNTTAKARFTETGLIPTPHYFRQFVLSLGKESPYISFKFNPFNTETLLRGTLSMPPSVSALMAALKFSFHKATSTENR